MKAKPKNHKSELVALDDVENTPPEIVEEFVVIDDKDDPDNTHGLICEMAKVADFLGYKLWIWTDDDGKIPHFHIIKGKPTAPDFDACVKFESAEYFPHGGRHTDKLPRNHLKQLIDLLNSQEPYAIGEQTVWQTLIIEWNRNDNKTKVSPSIPMPDFMHITYPTSGKNKVS